MPPADNSPSAANLRQLFEAVAAGRLSPQEAEQQLRRQQVEELGFATIDLQRQARRGRPEVIYCQGKTSEQIVAIARRMVEAGQNVLMTRLTDEQLVVVEREFISEPLHVVHQARIAQIVLNPVRKKSGVVAVLAAGTSDLPVAEEAAFTAEALGSTVERAYDVGVAGLHRLLRRADLLARARVLVVVAGMEGALPSVVSGLVPGPVIAVPTSVGYGANLGGLSALLTMINSCSPGISVVNIDNGFGAGYLADLINEIGEPRPAN